MTNILFVNDYDMYHEIINQYTESKDYTIDHALNGSEALEKINASDFDLIILDERMPPGKSGSQVLAEMRKSGNNTPVIFVSAYQDKTLLAEIKKAASVEPMADISQVRTSGYCTYDWKY